MLLDCADCMGCVIPERSETEDPVSGKPGGKLELAWLAFKPLVWAEDMPNISSLGMEYMPQLVGSKDPEEASSDENEEAAFVLGAYPPQLIWVSLELNSEADAGKVELKEPRGDDVGAKSDGGAMALLAGRCSLV